MDAVWILATTVAFSVVVHAFSAWVGAALERWRDAAGIDPPKRSRRISTARSTIGMALVIYGAGVGTGVAILGGAWIAVGAALVVGGFVGGILVLRRGRQLPPPPAQAPGPPHTGLAYFWHCWLPSRMLDFGRVLVLAIMAPPGSLVMLLLGEWIGAAVFAALGVASWVALLKLRPRTVPRRGPCLRAE